MGKKKKKAVGRPKTGQIPTLSFRASLEKQAEWRAKAKRAGLTLSQWLRKRADEP